MKSRIAMAISALTLGTALTAVPSFAQTYGARNGPEVQQESTGKVPQQESTACVHFQQGCSDKPYPMASSNNERSSERTGARLNREARSASGRERIGGRERLRANARVSERERGGVRVGERAGTSDEYMRSAASEPSRASERVASRGSVSGETFGAGGRRDYYNYAPGVAVAGAPGSAIAMCETRFRSFDPATGTYMGFDGIRHPCP